MDNDQIMCWSAIDDGSGDRGVAVFVGKMSIKEKLLSERWSEAALCTGVVVVVAMDLVYLQMETAIDCRRRRRMGHKTAVVSVGRSVSQSVSSIRTPARPACTHATKPNPRPRDREGAKDGDRIAGMASIVSDTTTRLKCPPLFAQRTGIDKQMKSVDTERHTS